ncbi:hypothetical protein HNP00_000997 [Arthrobacter sp. AZCC_0090]|nr:hypothetical protein [Arthrobacter sp. AZCC_0090]
MLRLVHGDRPRRTALKVPGCKRTMPRGERAIRTAPEDQLVEIMASARARAFSTDRAGVGCLAGSACAVFALR